MWIRKGLFFILCFWAAAVMRTWAAAPEIPLFEDGDTVGFIGDSVTTCNIQFVKLCGDVGSVLSKARFRSVQWNSGIWGRMGFKAGMW